VYCDPARIETREFDVLTFSFSHQGDPSAATDFAQGSSGGRKTRHCEAYAHVAGSDFLQKIKAPSRVVNP